MSQITSLISTTSLPPTTHHPQSLTSLCQLWSNIRDDSLPSICLQLISHDDGNLHLQTAIPDTRYFSPVHDYRDSLEDGVVREGFATGRNVSIAAVLAGVLAVLLLIAFVMCIRQKKIYQAHNRDNTRMVYRMRNLNRTQPSHHLLSTLVENYPVDVPPDYQTVMMVEERDEDLPSYDEAVIKVFVRDADEQEESAL